MKAPAPDFDDKSRLVLIATLLALATLAPVSLLLA
jgi:hypothetical protein